MKRAVFILCSITLWVLINAMEKKEKAADDPNRGYMARVLRARLMPMGGFCGKYKDPCGVMLPCCEALGYECDYSGGYSTGRCMKDWE